jgi:hypothetical protein
MEAGRRMIVRYASKALFPLLVLTLTHPICAQEAVGKRVFPDQLVISEPFVEDELSLPSIVHIPRGRSVGGRLTDVGGEVKKRITTDLELSVAGGYTCLEERQGMRSGFDNVELGVKYEFFRSSEHATVASLALQWEIGGTGRAATGAAAFDTVSPTLLIGQGLGEFPERFRLLKPFAVSGALGFEVPVRDRPPSLVWGAVLEYSLPYLEMFVRSTGLPSPFNQLVPIVETDLKTDLGGRLAGQLRGTVNPGVIWIGRTLQMGIETVVPLETGSGHGLGVRIFVRLPLEKLFGDRAGEPIIGGR